MMKMLPALLLISFAAPTLAGEPFTVTSKNFADGGRLPDSAVYEGFGCHGANRSPALLWSPPPPETKSLAITVYDPDAPTGSGWWHWVVFNLPQGTRTLPEGATKASLPDGAIESRTDYGSPGFGGACPPEGDAPHHYIFTVYALDVPTLPLNADAPAAMVGFMLNKHALGKAVMTAVYGRM